MLTGRGQAECLRSGPGSARSRRPGSAPAVTVCLCVSEDKERMETAGGPELHRPALVPALHRLLRRHGNQPSLTLTACL